ncbi:MAG: dTDP-4-dehydrorhamnose reductase [Planctomycetota bacterium]
MKILVTGAAGMLGSALVSRLSPDHDVTGVDVGDFNLANLDITVRSVREAAPDVLVNCAAWTDVDGAEANETGAFLVNAVGAKNAALAANEAGARILQVSTDYVFDGRTDTPYIESDPVSPCGVYGRSKWMGERFVMDVADRWTIVRTQALYGAQGPSFVKAISARVAAGEALSVVEDQTVSPTRAADLADAIARIVAEGTPGIYHASSRGMCTWFDFAQEICAGLGKADHPISAMKSEYLDRPAPRPAFSVLRNLHLELTIGDVLPHWKEALATHLQETAENA